MLASKLPLLNERSVLIQSNHKGKLYTEETIRKAIKYICKHQYTTFALIKKNTLCFSRLITRATGRGTEELSEIEFEQYFIGQVSFKSSC